MRKMVQLAALMMMTTACEAALEDGDLVRGHPDATDSLEDWVDPGDEMAMDVPDVALDPPPMLNGCVETCQLALEHGCEVQDTCVSSCQEDMMACPAAMDALMDCYMAQDWMECGPLGEQDISAMGCELQYTTVQDECGKAPF